MTAAGAAAPAAEVLGAIKSFGASRALQGVTIMVPVGDSRALVGRNGAGKSTLVAILTGLLAADAGTVRLDGEASPGLADRGWWRRRVACVYQRSTVIPALTVAENLFINAQPTRAGWIDWPSLRRRAEAALAEWDLEVDVTAEAADLGVEQRQIVEIARALLAGTRFIILDEPTAQLEAREVARLFDRIHRLQRGGVTFLYISHHLEEIYEICRTVTVLRDGGVVADAPLADMPKDQIVRAMVGEAGRIRRRGPDAKGDRSLAETCLAVAGLEVGTAVRGIDFAVAKGECVGLAGLAGSGKEEVGDALAGLLRPDRGEIRLEGRALPRADVAAFRKAGVGHVPRDRHRLGIIPQLGLDENLTLTILERLGRLGFINPARREAAAGAMMGEFQIKAASPVQPIGELSGGNQQKALMGRALASAPRLLVIAHPTQGVDVAAKDALFHIIDEAKETGTGVLLISDDLDELVVCDRVLVIFKGRLTAAFPAGAPEHDIVAAIEGVGHGG